LVSHATRERGHRVGEQASENWVGVPFSVAICGVRAPCGHHPLAEWIDREAANIIAIAKQRARDVAKAFQLPRRLRRIEQRDEVVHLDQRRDAARVPSPPGCDPEWPR
jgi:hypothetical protein